MGEKESMPIIQQRWIEQFENKTKQYLLLTECAFSHTKETGLRMILTPWKKKYTLLVCFWAFYLEICTLFFVFFVLEKNSSHVRSTREFGSSFTPMQEKTDAPYKYVHTYIIIYIHSGYGLTNLYPSVVTDCSQKNEGKRRKVAH